MLAMVSSSAVVGLDALPIHVEVRVSGGKNTITIIGLADSAIQESRGRIVSCLEQNGFHCSGEILINLAPAELKKEGSSFDLPIAIGILLASGQLRSHEIENMRFVGELALDGKVRAVKGVIAHVIEALHSGATTIVVPQHNVAEALLIEDIEIVGVRTLTDVIQLLRDGECPTATCSPHAIPQSVPSVNDFSQVSGQELVKRALVVAAAGGHNAIMIGPPGCGKSMLAKRFGTLLPPLDKKDALEVARIHSIAGLEIENIIQGLRPFRAPHHVITQAGLIGGGSSYIRPGEVSLAHRGVLFLDEFPEYKRSVLEAMRAPLEDGRVRVSRAKGSYLFPARFQLLAAMNPCPCGKLGSGADVCRCSRSRVESYLQKLSQPILDRIDIHVEMQPVSISEMTTAQNVKPEVNRQSILQCHETQLRRGFRNADANFTVLTHPSMLTSCALSLVEESAEKLQLSARSIVRVLRVARTIADLDTREITNDGHVAEALQYRSLDRIACYARGH